MPYLVKPTALADVVILEPRVFADDRGFFVESFNQRDFETALGVSTSFVQDNHSRSKRGVLRGLHYQIDQVQGKLVRVTHGRVFDVAVNLKRDHPDFGRWVGVYLDGSVQQSLWVPPGFAHGFLVLSETADFLYKTTDYYSASGERCIRWDDPSLAIEWPLEQPPLLTDKDARGSLWTEADYF